jgi:probable phosphoglycerate mutase
VRQQFPDSHRVWSDQPHEFRMSAKSRATFFPVRELFEQASRFWQDFLGLHSRQTVALVTHGGTARALISTAVGIRPEHFHSLQQSNCGISILEFPPSGSTAQIEALNLTAHLAERMPKLKRGRQGTRIILVACDSRWQDPAHLAGMLDDLQVDFVLAADDPQSRGMGHALSESHRGAQLGILPARVLDDTQSPETLLLAAPAPRTSSRNVVFTGVFVGTQSHLSAMLSKVLRVEGDGSPWTHPTNAVLHYPGTSGTPVIQAFNMSVWKGTVEPVTAEVHP